jgi:hypothetical protein
VVSGPRALALVAVAATLAVAPAGGCGSFESPDIVIDLRILGIQAEPPEVVVALDDPEEIDFLAIPSVEVCALIADPAASRRLVYDLVACPPGRGGRCNPEDPQIQLGNGLIDDPEEAADPVRACGNLVPVPLLVDVVTETIRRDPLGSFDGVPVSVQLAVRPEGAPEDETEFALKRVFFSDERPAGRVANQNPFLDGFTAMRDPIPERGRDFALPLGRCADNDAPATVSPGERLTLLPLEPDGVREDYVLPTFEGGARRFTESLRYAFYATEGAWNRFETGGPRDFAGNEPPLDSTWTAPAAPDLVGDGLDVEIWIVQRDERGGLEWYQSCIRVLP